MFQCAREKISSSEHHIGLDGCPLNALTVQRLHGVQLPSQEGEPGRSQTQWPAVAEGGGETPSWVEEGRER